MDSMESSEKEVSEDDDGLLDDDITGGDELLDEAELDYCEDILEEATGEQFVADADKPPSAAKQPHSIEECTVDIEEGEISSEEEAVDKVARLKSKTASKINLRRFRSSITSHDPTKNTTSSSTVCRHYLAGTCDWGKECRFFHPPREARSGTHQGGRHLHPYPHLPSMGRPEFIGPMASAAHFGLPFMPPVLPPHMMPAEQRFPQPPFVAPFHPVPVISPFNDHWRYPSGPHHASPPFREQYKRMTDVGEHESLLEESATWVRLKTKVFGADYHGDLRSKLKATSSDHQLDSDSDGSTKKSKKVEKRSKKRSRDGRSPEVKFKHKKSKQLSSCGVKKVKKVDAMKKVARHVKAGDVAMKDSDEGKGSWKEPSCFNRQQQQQQRKLSHNEDRRRGHSSDEEHAYDNTTTPLPPDSDRSSPEIDTFGLKKSESSNVLNAGKKSDDFKWSFKIGDEKQRRLCEELKVVDNAIKRKIAAKRR